ncbi:DUF3185 family protein [Lacihabitans sp. LS3-19]|uniref:DUF3185 family protein n=1 Tax=Lacihabitans sp. LS3-19 TaxID=2487335 RepID=UPI0020CB6D74|nr:DUF3185 family protein [Lacihabitans sp. LS3-19]MCP9769417.1 DUF3185 family protein [Lacihabitans sp. LS3-19]
MNNKTNIIIIAVILFILGLILVLYGLNYNNSEIVQVQNGIAELFKTEQNHKGDYFVLGGAISVVVGIIIFFKNAKN